MLFFEYIRLLEQKSPLFFLAENVSGILHPKHAEAFSRILAMFADIGYEVRYDLLNASDFGVPQDRKRVIIIGYRKDIGKSFDFTKFRADNFSLEQKTLKDAIGDLPSPLPALNGNKRNLTGLEIANHEFAIGGFSTIYMSRNRVRTWDEPSFTIQAGGRHAPIHPSAPKMRFVEQNKRIFEPGAEDKYRRMSVRECARVQTFPDTHLFCYENVMDGYKMVGNAVPCEFARKLALQIREDLYTERGEKGLAPQRLIETPVALF
jgi:DNA (cytosine-5)-methyltransferase 1